MRRSLGDGFRRVGSAHQWPRPRHCARAPDLGQGLPARYDHTILLKVATRDEIGEGTIPFGSLSKP
jgi:hypothetical protein